MHSSYICIPSLNPISLLLLPIRLHISTLVTLLVFYIISLTDWPLTFNISCLTLWTTSLPIHEIRLRKGYTYKLVIMETDSWEHETMSMNLLKRCVSVDSRVSHVACWDEWVDCKFSIWRKRGFVAALTAPDSSSARASASDTLCCSSLISKRSWRSFLLVVYQ